MRSYLSLYMQVLRSQWPRNGPSQRSPEPEVAGLGLALEERPVVAMRLGDDRLRLRRTEGPLAVPECVDRLAVGRLVPSEPLADAGDGAGVALVDVVDVVDVVEGSADTSLQHHLEWLPMDAVVAVVNRRYRQ